MIDYLKIFVMDMAVYDYFLNHEKLAFVRETKRYNKEYVVITKEYKGIVFLFYENCLWIYFKPHYFFNNNLHNSNDFTVYNCICVLNSFLETFGEVRDELMQCQIINLEFGVNVISPICVKELIDSILYHGKNLFRIYENLPYAKISSKIRKNGKANDYKMIKAYAKGLQVFPNWDNQHNPNTFRFEVKSKQSKYINKLGIRTFGDLLNPQIYETLVDHILKELQEVLIIDSSAVQELSNKEKKNFYKYLIPKTWHSYIDASRNTFNNNRNKYYSLLGGNPKNLRDSLIKLITEKLEYLKNCADSTPVQLKVQINDSAYYNNSIIGNCTKENKLCLVSGLIRPFENGGGNTLTETEIRYYRKHEPELYKKIMDKYSTAKWTNSPTKIREREAAHNIRDHKRNQRVSMKNRYKEGQLNLLDSFRIVPLPLSVVRGIRRGWKHF